MSLTLYDSLSNTLKSINGEITIYLCGPTVYDHIHIGNLAPVVIFDFLIRYIREKGIKYTYIHNITDIDDKIIARSRDLGITEDKLAKDFSNKYLKILDTFSIVRPTHIPRVSEHIPEIIDTIGNLIDKGYAYPSGGDVLFNIGKVPEYGELSNQKLDNLRTGEGQDFCLWKCTGEGKVWDSPWGKGRPGWHTECYSFIGKYAGGRVNIHGGGVDLKFPHHENENAHCRALCGLPLADIWVHIGHLSTGEGKISKSGNLKFLVKDLLEKYSPNIIRYYFLTVNHRAPSIISLEKLDAMGEEFGSFLKILNQARSHLYLNGVGEVRVNEVGEEFLSHIGGNLHLPGVLTWLHSQKKLLTTSIKGRDWNAVSQRHAILCHHLTWLGFQIPNIHSKDNRNLLDNWKNLLSQGKYGEADQVRNELKIRNLI